MSEQEPAAFACAAAPRKRGRWVIWLLSLMLLLMAGVFGLWLVLVNASLGGSDGAQMVAAQYTPKDVVGDVGGMKVTIPRHMAEFVEYEGDPGWGESRQGPRPPRTHDSRLTSFGVTFRYPDMATLSSPEMWADKKAKSIYVTDWMNFGVTTGNRYPSAGDGGLDRLTKATLNKLLAKKYTYVKQPQREHGLESYLLVDPSTGKPGPNTLTVIGESLFIARNAQGQVTAYIECSTVSHQAAPCSHMFSLEKLGVKALVRIGYRRPLLAHWQDTQAKVKAMILGFKVTPPSEPVSTPTPSAPR
jgi:hypothetical protein